MDCHGFTSRERCDSEQPQMEDKSKFGCKGTNIFWSNKILRTKLCKINKIFRVPLFPRGSIGTKNIWNVQLKKQRASSILQQNYQLGSDPKLPIFVNLHIHD